MATLAEMRLKVRRKIDDLNVGTDADAASGTVRWSTEEIDTALADGLDLLVSQGAAAGLAFLRSTVSGSIGSGGVITLSEAPIKVSNVLINAGGSFIPVSPGAPGNRGTTNISSSAVQVDLIRPNVFPALASDSFTYAQLALSMPVLDNYLAYIAIQDLWTKVGEFNQVLEKQAERWEKAFLAKPVSPSMAVIPFSAVFNNSSAQFYWYQKSPTEIQVYL